ncbi:MAG: type II secretion system protein GspM [Geminicoccaceae bacterium]
MIDRLSPPQQRALALLLLLLVLGVIAAAVLAPFGYLRNEERALEQGAQRVAELQARLPGREELLARERELQGTVDAERTLLPGSTPAVAAAQLQGDLAGLAAAMGGEITTVQILEPESTPPFARIGLRLSLSGDMATVRDFLYAVETREPMLIVRRMDLSVAAASEGSSAENPPLAATFEIYGYAPGAVLQ